MAQVQTTEQEFGKWRSRLWPIHSYELKKLVPMVFMFFLILFNYTFLRDTKDTLLVQFCSAAAIPFVKVYGTVPLAILFLIGYSKMSNVLSREKLFYWSIIPFIAWFALFPVLIYPNLEALAPSASADALATILPAKLQTVAEIYRYWPIPIFYIMSELWGSVCLSLLFWGFANQITRVNEAKRLYPLFGLFGNLALIISGPMIVWLSRFGGQAENAREAYGTALYFLMGVVVAAAFVIMGIYRWINRNVLTDPRFMPTSDQVKKKKSKPKMSLMQSFAYLARSKYLLCLAILVIGYGFAINLVEVTWKGQLQQQFPNPSDYCQFMGIFSMMTGLITIFMMLFVGGNVMRRFGWRAGAIFTPMMLLVTGIGFFAFIIFRDSLGGIVSLFSTTPLFLAVVFGAIQNILSKGAKYSLFDPTKEMAYIPLDDEQKVKGKAAIDVAAARIGKSGGSLVQQFLIGTIGFAAMTPYVAALVLCVVLVWIGAANALSKLFHQANAKREAEEAAEAAAGEAVAVGASATGETAGAPITAQ